MTRPILIIEDDADISESLKYNFEREGLAAVTAPTGEAGLAAAVKQPAAPRLIILDLMLPGMSGIELCRRLRREPATRRTPIIMLTAKASASDRVTGLDLGDIRVAYDGVKIKLTNKEFTLLSVLARSADRVVTRQQLLDSVWGYSYYGDARTLDVHIRRLRQKLDKCGDCIETVVGVGYRFVGCTSQAAVNGNGG